MCLRRVFIAGFLCNWPLHGAVKNWRHILCDYLLNAEGRDLDGWGLIGTDEACTFAGLLNDQNKFRALSRFEVRRGKVEVLSASLTSLCRVIINSVFFVYQVVLPKARPR